MTHDPSSSELFSKKAWSGRIPWYKYGRVDKADFWLEKLERDLDELRCPVDQKAICVVSLLQGVAYDWWKLVLRNILLPDPEITLSHSLIRSMSLMITRSRNGSNS